MAQSTRWCFTINNYSAQEVDHLISIVDDVRYLIFGKETGASGILHLQGFVIFHSNKRLAAVRLAISNRAHVEAARGTSE